MHRRRAGAAACDDERHWLRIAPRLIGHLFPRLLAKSEYNTRLRQLAPLMEAALRWPGTAVVTDKGLSGRKPRSTSPARTSA